MDDEGKNGSGCGWGHGRGGEGGVEVEGRQDSGSEDEVVGRREEEGDVVGEKEEEEDEVVEPERWTEGDRNRQGEWPLKGV